MDRFRLESFSDAVFAVAITLLALNISIEGPGHGALLRQLAHEWPAFTAYLVSFFTIGIIWVNHHTMVRGMVAIDRMLLFLNLTLLLFVALIPFATAVLAKYLAGGGRDSRVAMILYCAIFEGMALGFAAMFEWTLHGQRMHYTVPPGQRRLVRLRFTVGAAVYLVAAATALISALVALAVVGLISIYYISERTPGGEEPQRAPAEKPRDPANESPRSPSGHGPAVSE